METKGVLGTCVWPRGRRRLSDLGSASDSDYAAYLRGRRAVNPGALDGMRNSLDLLATAVQEDPQFALAYAALADAHLSLVGRWMASPSAQYAAAQRASLWQPPLDHAKL